MTLTVASVVRNEAERFLPDILGIWADFADRIVVLGSHKAKGKDE